MERDKYVVALGETRPATKDKPSASAIYRHAGSKDGFPKLEVNTLYELFTRSVEKYADKDCLGQRVKNADGTAGPFKYKSYKAVGEEVKVIANGLAAIGVKPKQRVGILGPNCPDWMETMQVSHCRHQYSLIARHAYLDRFRSSCDEQVNGMPPRTRTQASYSPPQRACSSRLSACMTSSVTACPVQRKGDHPFNAANARKPYRTYVCYTPLALPPTPVRRSDGTS